MPAQIDLKVLVHVRPALLSPTWCQSGSASGPIEASGAAESSHVEVPIPPSLTCTLGVNISVNEDVAAPKPAPVRCIRRVLCVLCTGLSIGSVRKRRKFLDTDQLKGTFDWTCFRRLLDRLTEC